MTAETMLSKEETQKVEVDASPPQEENVDETKDESKPTKTVEKCSSYKEESNCLSDLKEFEKKALSEFKSKVEDSILGNTLFHEIKKVETLPTEGGEEDEKVVKEEENVEENDLSLWGVSLLPSKGNEGIDVVLLKFLRAREFKVNEAFEMLKKTLKWRKEMKIDSILEENFGSDFALASYMNGVDREGHPVCYNIYGVLMVKRFFRRLLGLRRREVSF